MKSCCSIALLCGCYLLGGPAARAAQGPRPAVVSASPDSALVRLTAAQVNAEYLQHLATVRWRYRPGQPPGWASPATDDRGWLLADPSFHKGEGPPGWRGTGCFRLRLVLDSALLGQPLGLHILHEGASEIYLDGRRLGRYGTVGLLAQTTRGFFPHNRTLFFVLTTPGPHLLAIRYAKFDHWAKLYAGFDLWAAAAERLTMYKVQKARDDMFYLTVVVGTAVLAFLHFFLFLFYRSQRANLYYSLYLGAAAGTQLSQYLVLTLTGERARWAAQLGYEAGTVLSCVLLLTFIYAVCHARLSRPWLGLLGLAGTIQVALWLTQAPLKRWTPLPVLTGIFLLAWLDMLRVLARALRQGQSAVGLVALGVGSTMLVNVFVFYDSFHLWDSEDPFAVVQQLIMQSGFLLLPVCTSLYLARDFATTRRDLEMQLEQVHALSDQTQRQEAERQRLIRAQNEQLESTVQVRTEEIRQQNRLLATQKAEITQRAEALRMLDVAKSRFFANITHEFRTPLTLILGPAGQILAESQEPGTRQLCGLVQRNAQRLLRLINQLLDLSKLEGSNLTLEPICADLVPFVRGLLGAFESLAQQRGIATSFTADPAEFVADFDPDKLEKIVYNLLSNAFKFTPRAGQVAVRLYQPAADDAWVSLEVRDTGCGIMAAQLPHVFDRFYQADSSETREQEGTGIGLALAKELAELHGGTIALASEPGVGTTATVRLPVRRVAAPAGALPPPPEPAVELGHEPAAATAAEAALVLIIEDNADVRAFVRAALAAHYHVLEAVNGEQGVALAREHIPDLVLTDVMMPRLDGHGVCRALRANERTNHIPVVMLTARADADSKLDGLHSGADAYLAKPFSTPELLATIDNLLRGRQYLREAYHRGLAAHAAPGLPSMEQTFLARVRAVVEQHLDDEEFNVEALGREVGLSRTQLHRKLKALLCQAPGDFIRLVRLQRAQELLASNVGTVAEIAYQVGYSNPANFSTSFSRHYGYSPSEARKHTTPPE